jgi:hypothetical protein
MIGFKGLWDTGASASVITPAVVKACALKPIGMKQVHTAGGTLEAETFLVNIGLPNKVAFPNVEVTLSKTIQGADLLIGMDLITRGDFSITNQGDATVFTFRTPSVHTLDFVVEAQQSQRRSTSALQKPRPPGFWKKKR